MSLAPREQSRILHALSGTSGEIIPFTSRLKGGTLKPLSLATMQINVGKMCNQTCKHCHVDAGPTRKEIMTRATMEQCLNALDSYPNFKIVDLTGGAPEMNPDFRWFVGQIKSRGRHTLVRCNLTILEANEKYAYLPAFYAENWMEVISSLPSFDAATTNRQRGDNVFEKSIVALRDLNFVGYGRDPHLMLHLVYNPNGAFLPGNQEDIEKEFKERLAREYDIVFNNLFTITNMPISRFLEYLVTSKNLEPYMKRLNQQFNAAAVKTVMCRSMISISWDGEIYDCDFNQMLELKTAPAMTIADFNAEALLGRKIAVGPHCYGCTAGAGSSCGGSLV